MNDLIKLKNAELLELIKNFTNELKNIKDRGDRHDMKEALEGCIELLSGFTTEGDVYSSLKSGSFNSNKK